MTIVKIHRVKKSDGGPRIRRTAVRVELDTSRIKSRAARPPGMTARSLFGLVPVNRDARHIHEGSQRALNVQASPIYCNEVCGNVAPRARVL